MTDKLNQDSVPSSQQQTGGVLKAAGTVSSLTVLSRIFGLVRDVLSAVVFGSSAVWDSFVLAFTVPNLFRRIFGEGALTSAFLPAAVKARKEDGIEKAGSITSAVVTIVGFLLFGVACIIALITGIWLWAKGASVDSHLASFLLLILIFYLPFICLSAVLQAALNSVKHFALPAFTPVLLNLVWITVLGVMLWVFPGSTVLTKVFVLAAAVVAAGILQFGVQIPALWKRGIKLRISRDFGQEEVKGVFRAMIPVVLALVVMQINVLVDRLLAKFMIEGSGAISALFYGNRLIQFPLAVFGIAVGVAVFPSLREFAVDRNYTRIWNTLNFGIRILILIIIPSSVGLIVIGQPVIDLFFNWGAFAESPQAAQRVYFVLAAYSAGLLFFCFNILITRTFHSLDNRVFPAKIAGLMVILNIILNLLFLKFTPLEEAGLALSTSITACVNVVILAAALVKKFGFSNINGILPVSIRSVAAAGIMGTGVILLAGFGEFSFIPWGSGLSGKLLRVTAGVAGGAVLYGGMLVILRTSELKNIRSLISKH